MQLIWHQTKVHPKAKRFRTSICPKYEELITIFGDTTAISKEDMDSDVEEIDSEVEKNLNIFNSSDGKETKKFYLFDEKEDDAIELVVTATIEKYYNLYLCKQPYRNDNLIGAEYVMRIILENSNRCLDLFRIDSCIFLNFCSDLR
uniref:Uncharacterized protein LOC105045210 isoform X2 n=1 Tax=Elaeis guineensis var. tenera TaxID=51953 RepID=A0A6J0PIL8_ELAGV|nr:uncharacterized protein LOC105045210 isoform X2 [Elaeis guineensis]